MPVVVGPVVVGPVVVGPVVVGPVVVGPVFVTQDGTDRQQIGALAEPGGRHPDAELDFPRDGRLPEHLGAIGAHDLGTERPQVLPYAYLDVRARPVAGKENQQQFIGFNGGATSGFVRRKIKLDFDAVRPPSVVGVERPGLKGRPGQRRLVHTGPESPHRWFGLPPVRTELVGPTPWFADAEYPAVLAHGRLHSAPRARPYLTTRPPSRSSQLMTPHVH